MRQVIASFLVVALLLAGMMIYTACDESSVAQRGNQPPVIESVLANPDTVLINALCELLVIASDANGDSLRYQWSANSGTFTSGTQDTAATWQATDVPGTYRITVAVSDNDSTVTGNTNVVVTSTSVLSVSEDTLNFEPGTNTQTFTIENTGTGDMVYNLAKTADWLTLSKTNGTLTAERRAGKTA